MKLYKKIIIAASVIGVVSSQLRAQDTKTNTPIAPTTLELFKTQNLWANTINAAGLNTVSQLEYTDVEGGYKSQNGSYHRPQDGKCKGGFVFDAEGSINLLGGYLWGKFSFENENRKGSRFNTSIIDPFRGMPYIKADSISAEWKVQYYNMEVKAATPRLFDQLYGGLGIKYNLATGAKQLDPRPANRSYSLELTPSVTWLANEENKIGATFYYRNHREKSDLDSKYNEYKEVYYLEGLGAFTSTTTIGASRDYRGNEFGGELQYAFINDNINFLLSGGYRYDYENVIDGTRKLTNSYKTETDFYYIDAAFILKGDKHTQKISANFTKNKIHGIFYDRAKDPSNTLDYVVLDKRERSIFDTKQMGIAYDMYRLRGKGYQWNVGADVAYLSQEDLYRLPQPNVEASYQKIHRYDFGTHVKYNFEGVFNPDGSLLIGIDGLYSIASDCSLYYGGQDNNHVVIRELIEKDYDFLSSNYVKLGLSAQYSIPLSLGKTKVSAYGKASTFYIPKKDTSRNGFAVSVGFML